MILNEIQVGDLVYICRPDSIRDDELRWFESGHGKFDKKIASVEEITPFGNFKIDGSPLIFDKNWATKVDDDDFEMEDLSCLM